jgi:hypothetical protein
LRTFNLRKRVYPQHLQEIVSAVKEMPLTMRQLWWMKLFQRYAMMCYWVYIVPALALSIFGTRDPNTPEFRDASLSNGQIGGFYNFVAFIAAFAFDADSTMGSQICSRHVLVLGGLEHDGAAQHSRQMVAAIAHGGGGHGPRPAWAMGGKPFLS